MSTREDKRIQFNSIMCPVLSAAYGKLFPLWPAGLPGYGLTVLEMMTTEQGSFMTGQIQEGRPVGCLPEHIIEQVYGFLFDLHLVLKGPLQWYLVISLQVDKAGLS